MELFFWLFGRYTVGICYKGEGQKLFDKNTLVLCLGMTSMLNKYMWFFNQLTTLLRMNWPPRLVTEAASVNYLGGQGLLKKQKFSQKWRENLIKNRLRFCSICEWIFAFWGCSSEEVHRSCLDIHQGQNNLKTQKNVQKLNTKCQNFSYLI